MLEESEKLLQQFDVPSCSAATEGAYDKSFSFGLRNKYVITEFMLLYAGIHMQDAYFLIIGGLQ
jgi:hypothetical protein